MLRPDRPPVPLYDRLMPGVLHEVREARERASMEASDNWLDKMILSWAERDGWAAMLGFGSPTVLHRVLSAE